MYSEVGLMETCLAYLTTLLNVRSCHLLLFSTIKQCGVYHRNELNVWGSL